MIGRVTSAAQVGSVDVGALRVSFLRVHQTAVSIAAQSTLLRVEAVNERPRAHKRGIRTDGCQKLGQEMGYPAACSC